LLHFRHVYKSADAASFLEQAIPCLPLFCHAFPIMFDDVLALLIEISPELSKIRDVQARSAIQGPSPCSRDLQQNPKIQQVAARAFHELIEQQG